MIGITLTTFSAIGTAYRKKLFEEYSMCICASFAFAVFLRGMSATLPGSALNLSRMRCCRSCILVADNGIARISEKQPTAPQSHGINMKDNHS
jgi:hypothetical protein